MVFSDDMSQYSTVLPDGYQSMLLRKKTARPSLCAYSYDSYSLVSILFITFQADDSKIKVVDTILNSF